MRKQIILFLFMSTSLVSAEANTTEFDSLKSQISMLMEINTKLLNTVYWTIGTFAFIITVVFAINWFFNLNSNKRDLKNYKDELRNEIKKDFEIFKQNTSSMQSEEYERNRKNIDETINYLVSLKMNETMKELDSIHSELDKISRELLLNSIKHCDVLVTKLRQYLVVLQIDIKIKYGFRINHTLDEIFALLNKTEVDSDFAKELIEVTKNLDETYQKQIDRINAAIRLSSTATD